jgi:DNA repair protein RadA/Sms
MAKVKPKAEKSHFFCTACGHETSRWFGRCPSCEAWNTAAEAPAAGASRGRRALRYCAPRQLGGRGCARRGGAPRPLAEVETTRRAHDQRHARAGPRARRRGRAGPALILVGGDPGIGKSTLMLQLAAELAGAGKRVLYVSGEESAEQVRLRATRLGSVPEGLLIHCGDGPRDQ